MSALAGWAPRPPASKTVNMNVRGAKSFMTLSGERMFHSLAFSSFDSGRNYTHPQGRDWTDYLWGCVDLTAEIPICSRWSTIVSCTSKFLTRRFRSVDTIANGSAFVFEENFCWVWVWSNIISVFSKKFRLISRRTRVTGFIDERD